MPVYPWWTYLLLSLPGAFFYMMNWVIVLHNRRSDDWSSPTLPLGGAWIALVMLLTPVRLLALIGLSDPGFWLIVRAVIDHFIHKKD